MWGSNKAYPRRHAHAIQHKIDQKAQFPTEPTLVPLETFKGEELDYVVAGKAFIAVRITLDNACPHPP